MKWEIFRDRGGFWEDWRSPDGIDRGSGSGKEGEQELYWSAEDEDAEGVIWRVERV